MSIPRIDINVDIGEGFPHDRELLRFASSANVCCGEHAGSRELTAETVAMCREAGIRVGAHPGYPDRASMGRAPLDPSNTRAWLDSIVYQVRWFYENFQPEYLKPHGAFYNETAVLLPYDWQTALDMIPEVDHYRAIGRYVAEYPGVQTLGLLLRVANCPLMGLPGTLHEIAPMKGNTHLIREGFADRRYLANGALVPRNEAGAVLKDIDEVKRQVSRLAYKLDTICIHGDTPDCLEFAETVYRTLIDHGFEVGA